MKMKTNYLYAHARRKAALILGGMFCAFAAWGQAIQFEHLPANLGLSRRSVRAIVQDNQGFIWLGTSDGLLRFDGYAIKAFRNRFQDSTSLSDNNIRALFKDSYGDLWIGVQGGGLNHFHSETEIVTRYQHQEDNPNSIGGDDVWTITEDAQGNIWVGTWSNGLNCWNRQMKSFTTYRHNPKDENSIGNGPVWSVVTDTEGYIWAATDGGGVSRFNPDTQRFTNYRYNPEASSGLSDNFCHVVYQDQKGFIWVGTKLGRLNRLDMSTGKWKQFQLSQGKLENIDEFGIHDIVEVAPGVLWIATDVGLQVLEVASEEVTIYQYDPSNPLSLSNNSVRAIYQDATQLMWVGNEDGGVNKVLEQKQFIHYTNIPSDPNSLSFRTVRSFGEDLAGNLWIGTQGGGLNRFNENKQTFTHYENDPNNPASLGWDEVSAIHEDTKGRLWVGTWGDGIKQLDRSTETFRHIRHNPEENTSISSDFIQFIYEDSRGILWVGTEKGLNRLQPDGSWYTYLHDPNDSTSLNANNLQSKAFVEDRNGYLWFGTWKGLNRYNRDTDTFRSWGAGENLLSNEHVISLHDDGEGNLWIGTFGGGLNKFEKATETFTFYTEEDGLPNNVIFGILEDRKGNLWMSTNNGLAKFNPTNETFQNYTESDGLQGNEFYWGGAYQLSDGRMVFGGVNGFNIFYPDSIVNNPHVPPVRITAFRKYGKDAQFTASLQEISEIELSYQENFFSIEFTALNYRDTRKNQYAYKLEGFQDEWIYTGSRREASFTNLEGGTYTFMVKGSNNDNLWNDTPTTLSITIIPPIWEETWFKMIGGMLGILVILGVYRLRVNTIEAQKRKLAHQVEIRTKELKEANSSLQQQKTEIEKQAEELAQQRDNLSEANSIIGQRLNDIKTLSEIGQNVTASIDIQEVIARIYTSVNELMDAPNFEIGIIDWESGQIEYYGYHDKETDMQRGYSSVQNQGTLTSWCITHQKEIAISDVDTQITEYVAEVMAPKYRNARAKSINYIPLLIENQMMGMMITKSFQKNAYNDLHLQLLRNLASYISIALSNANAYQEINLKNDLMRDSISYGQTIQSAILPPTHDFHDCFHNHCLLYRPKDIVSGDFYWLNKTADYVFVAVVDCTGHGVPGAFMSLIGYSLLNRIVNEQGIHAPAMILQRLDEGIRRALRQDITENDDGMDLTLCRFERIVSKENEYTRVLYAGAKGNFWVHQGTALKRLKTTRRSIGGRFFGKSIAFKQDEISLQKGDRVYLLSDGLIDAVNPQRKRFGSQRFHHLLATLQPLSMPEQQQKIEAALDDFKQGIGQRDDITVLGLEI